MDSFTISFATANAAFADDNLARLLRDAAARIERGERDGKVIDANGNAVGKFYFD